MTKKTLYTTLAGTAAVAATAGVLYLTLPRPTNVAWQKTSDLPQTTPNGYTYEYRLVLKGQNNECYHDWTMQQTEPGKGYIYRDGIRAADGYGQYPPVFICNPQTNSFYVESTDNNWYVYAPGVPEWHFVGQSIPDPQTNPYPIYKVITGASCDPPNDATGWWNCVAPFEPINDQIPANSGSIFFYMRARYTDLVSPDAPYVLIGSLLAPNAVGIVPRTTPPQQ